MTELPAVLVYLHNICSLRVKRIQSEVFVDYFGEFDCILRVICKHKCKLSPLGFMNVKHLACSFWLIGSGG